MKTVGRIDPGRTAKIRCVRSENCENMPLQGRMFMLLLVLEGVLFAAIQQLFPRQRVSGALLLPHLLWGLYALLLNLSLLGRNLNL